MQTRYLFSAARKPGRDRLKYAGFIAGMAASLAFSPAKAEEAVTDAKDGTVLLAPLKVEGATENDGPLGPVIQQDSSMATKTDTPILDTARSVSVETRQQIEDKGFQRLEDAYMYTAGVHAGTAGFDQRGDWGSLRGFDMPVAYLDGLQFGNDGYYNFSLPAIEMLESVEILKGPAGSLYGASSVGGIVNAVSKRPQEETLRRATVEYGTFNRKQATIDMTGKLDDSGKILGRVVALLRDAETQVNYSKNDAFLFAPSITLRPDANTDITILGRYQKTNNSPDIQFLSQAGTLDPAPNGLKLPASTFIGEPDLNRMESVDEAITLDARHRFDEVWSVQGILRYSHSASHLDQAYWSYYGTQPDRYEPSGEIYRDFYKQNGATYMWVGDLNTTAKFTTGPVDHQVLMGVGYSNVKFDNDFNQCVPGDPCYTVGTIDPFNPTFTGVPDFDVIDNPTNTFKQLGVYAQDQATIFERIIFAGGLRWDKFNATDPYGGGSNDDHDVTYNASLLYKFDAGFSPYVSYAESFLQESYGTTFTGETFKPTHGKQYEAGLKYQPPGTASLFTVALFDITKSNILIPDPAHPATDFIQGGEARSKGVEFEAQTVIDDFYLEGNYAYLNTEDENGAPINYTARHQASGWVTWRPQGALQGFKLGGGIRYIGRSFYVDTYAPSNTLGDAMIGYETADWDLSLNARNLTDRVYVATAGAGSGFYGQRRTVILSLSRNF